MGELSDAEKRKQEIMELCLKDPEGMKRVCMSSVREDDVLVLTRLCA